MDCTRLQELAFEDPRLAFDRETRRAIDAHLAGCAECAAFAHSLRESDETAGDWTGAVLHRTGSDACASAFERLPEWIDGDGDAVERELVGAHVDGCGECASLAATMRAMARDLPQLAEADPGPDFVAAVLAATSGRTRAPRWAAKFDLWVASLLRRPRIAWEGAYLATACLLLMALLPGSPLAGATERALDLARHDPSALEQPFVALKANLNDGAQGAWATTQAAARTLADRAGEESQQAMDLTKQELGTLWNRLASSRENASTQGPDRKTNENGDDE